jgi:hypothetical protein
MTNGWEALQGILEEQREQAQQSKIDRTDRCPYDGSPLEIREDGTMHCEYDGLITLFDKLGEERRR